jgi:hypothetical protein
MTMLQPTANSMLPLRKNTISVPAVGSNTVAVSARTTPSTNRDGAAVARNQAWDIATGVAHGTSIVLRKVSIICKRGLSWIRHAAVCVMGIPNLVPKCLFRSLRKPLENWIHSQDSWGWFYICKFAILRLKNSIACKQSHLSHNGRFINMDISFVNLLGTIWKSAEWTGPFLSYSNM